MAEKWQFPSSLTYAICCHHEPEESEENIKLSAITNIANAFSYHENDNMDPYGSLVHHKSKNCLGLSDEDLIEIRENLEKALMDKTEDI